MKREQKAALEALANEFFELDQQRLELDRKNRLLKKRLKALQEGLQEFIGTADAVDVPLVSRIGKFFITQIKKHRGVPAYEYDFIEFRVIREN
jgi:hypothetical protein